MCITSMPVSPGQNLAEQRVEVGAVHVNQAASLVDDGGNLGDVLFKIPSVDGLVTIRPAMSPGYCATAARTVSADKARPPTS